MIDFKKYKAAIFDWDGTLVDSHSMILNAHNQVRKEFGEPEWTFEEFLKKPSLSGREFFGMVYPKRAQKADTIFYDFIERHHLEFLRPMDKAQDFLDLLDMPLGIVSNKRHPTLNIEIDHIQWRDRFTSIVGAGQAKRDKPAPDPLLMAMAEINGQLEGRDVLYFGDTETDLKTAQAVGADVVFIQLNIPRPDLIEKYNPTYHCETISELWGLVTKDTEPSNKMAS